MKRALLLLMLLPAAACASASAKSKTPEVRPPLSVPPPPPRVIEPLPSTEAPSLEPVADLPAAPTPPTPRPRQQPPRDQAKAEPKPENKPETPPEATTPAPTATPVPPLRTGNTADGPEAVKQVREVVDRTNRMLLSIDYRTLGNERKANYDTAKNFIKQAEEALKTGNSVFAKSLADNAERIARELGGK